MSDLEEKKASRGGKKKFMVGDNKPYVEIGGAEQLRQAMGTGCAVIDLWSPTCGPCMAMGPHFEAVAEAYADEPVAFYKLNTQQHPELSQRFNVRSVPTMLFVQDGEVRDVIVGAMDGPRLSAKVDWLMSVARGEGFLTRLLGRHRRRDMGPATEQSD